MWLASAEAAIAFFWRSDGVVVVRLWRLLSESDGKVVGVAITSPG